MKEMEGKKIPKDAINQKKISHKFYLVSFLLLSFVVVICVAFFLYDNSVVRKRIENNLLFENQRIASKLDDSLSYTKHIMHYIGGQIERNNAAKDYKFINQLLISYRVPNNDIMAWSTFSWVDEKFHLVVSSNHGIDLQNFANLSKRDYMPRTLQYPSSLQFGTPVFGVKSNLWSIPIGYGIVDKKGKYLGAIVTGLVIDGLQKRLNEIITRDKIFFILLDARNSEIIAKSDEIYGTTLKNLLKNIEVNSEEGMVYEDYFYYKKMANYPYVIATVYLPEMNFYNRWGAYFMLILIVIFLVGLPLILFERKLILPIKKLSKIAEDISLDKNPTFFKRSNIREIANLEKQLKNIQQYKADLLRAKNAQSNFFLNMSHELRTPLTGVISFAELLQREVYGPMQKEYSAISKQIYSSGKHLLLLIDNLLNFSKIKSGKMKLFRENIVITDEIQEAINKVFSEADKKNLAINVINESKAKVIKADRWMFQSIMLNLLSNAIKFSRENSEIRITIRINRKEELEIEVLDFGIGIKEEEVSIVLEEYGQAQDGYKNHNQKGTGLGLPLVQKMLSLHKGKINIESIYGKQTKVTVTFPDYM